MSNETTSGQTDTPMTTDRLQRLLDAYGGTQASWPEDVRAAAVALVAVSPEARAMQEAATGLDSMLDNLAPPAPSDDLLTRLERAGARHSRALPGSGSATRLLRYLAGFGSAGGQFSRLAPAGLGLAGVVLVGLSLFAIYRGSDDGVAPPERAVVAFAEPARDFLADMPLVDIAFNAGSDADEGNDSGAGRADDPADYSADDPWAELLPDDGSEEAIQLSYLPEAGLPLE